MTDRNAEGPDVRASRASGDETSCQASEVPQHTRIEVATLAAEAIGDLTFQRRVIRLCKHPRVVAELFAEIGAEWSAWAEIDAKLERYASINPETLALTGGDQFPPSPLHLVPREGR